MHWFLSLDDAYEKISNGANEYNNFRPHSSINDLTPAEIVAKHQIEFVSDVKNTSLPAAFHHEAMHFSAAEYDQVASENAYLHDQNLFTSKTPNSPT